MKLFKFFIPASGLIISTFPLKADTLTTGTTSGNRHQEYNIFDVNALNDVTITGFQQNFADAADYLYEVWYKEGTAAGTLPTSSVWKKIGTSSSFTISEGDIGSLTTVTFDGDVSLDLGSGKTYGFLVGGDNNDNDLLSEVRSGTTRQTSDSGALIGEVLASDSNLEITEGTHASTDDGIDIPPNISYYYYNWNGALVYNSSPTIDSNAVKPYGSMQSVAIDSIDTQRENILNLAGNCNYFGISLEEKLCGFSTFSNDQKKIDGTYGFDVDNFNSSYGLEYSFNTSLIGGLAYGYGSANLSGYSLSKISASIASNYNFYSGYIVKKYSDKFSLKSIIGLAGFNYEGKRYKNHTYADSEYSSDIFTSAVKGIWNLNSSEYKFKPSLGIALTNNSQDAFNETGSTHLLNVDSNKSSSFLLTSGISITKKKDSPNLSQWMPRLDLNYQYDLAADNDENLGVKAKLANGSASSSRHVATKFGAHSLKINLGIDKALTKKLTFNTNTSYSISNNASGYSYGAGLRFIF